MNKVIIGKMLIGLSIILGIYYLILDLWFRHASFQDFGMITLGGLDCAQISGHRLTFQYGE